MEILAEELIFVRTVFLLILFSLFSTNLFVTLSRKTNSDENSFKINDRSMPNKLRAKITMTIFRTNY